VLARFLARRRLGAVQGIHEPIESPTITPLFHAADLVICCANTASARLTAERQALACNISIIQAAAFDGRKRLGGLIHMHRQSMPDSSCYGCLLGTGRRKLARGEGLLASVTAIIGHLAAHVAVLELARRYNRNLSQNNLLMLDVDAGILEGFVVKSRPGCAVCRKTWVESQPLSKA
jgi:molybdopterin/thiamine biosynthesis adenylyltransferase